jgi:hypothetical protein
MAESARRRNVPPALTATASGRSIRRRKEGAAGGGDKTGGRMEHRCKSIAAQLTVRESH